MSETSPIKAELETIIGQKTGSLQKSSVKPILITTKTMKEEQVGEVMAPASEEEKEAQKAAVKAIEVAFMRKRIATKAEAPEEEAGQEGGEGASVPVAATRRSIKRRDGGQR